MCTNGNIFQKTCNFEKTQNMLTVIIVDDEINAIESLTWELNTTNQDIKVKATFTNAKNAINYLNENEVDAIFLDIEMPEMDGFEFLSHFPNRKFAVIITSAFTQYGISAIKFDCLDYLQKPIDSDDLNIAIQKIIKFKKEHQLIEFFENTLINNSATPKTNSKKISINADGKILYLSPDEIIFCESDGNYSTIYLTNGKNIVVTQKLKQIEDKLTEGFFRVHNSYIINLEKVSEYLKNDGYVILTNKTKIPVSRQRKALLLEKL